MNTRRAVSGVFLFVADQNKTGETKESANCAYLDRLFVTHGWHGYENPDEHVEDRTKMLPILASCKSISRVL